MSALADDYVNQRQQMVLEVQQMIAVTASSTDKHDLSKQVKKSMLSVPRHEFVPGHFRRNAYDNTALPIDHDQTISQPYIVALMTELADVSSESIVLEVGTGSGYQAAVLSGIVEHVYSIEIVEPLGLEAKALLKKLGYENVTVRVGDGYYGWPEQAPFDAILVTAAATEIPGRLIEQLKPGGRLVIPIGDDQWSQALKVLTKDMDGNLHEHEVLPVAFVPLTGEH